MADDVVITITSGTPLAAGTGDLYDLVALIVPEVPGSPDVAVRSALRLIARDFCRETEVWREEVTGTTTEDEDEYDLNTLHSYDAQVYRVLKLEQEDSTIDRDDYTFGPTGILTYDNAPDESDDTLTISTVLLPLISCTVYPQWLLDQWGDGIAAGTVARLAGQTGRPWSSPQVAALKSEEYRNAIAQAKGVVITGREDGNLRTQMRSFV